MKNPLRALVLAALLLVGTQSALAQNATYVFPYEGFRYTQRENETVLTQTNLQANQELIASLGTTPEAILASYVASGIVMEVIPQDGGQIAVSVVDAGDFSDVQSMDELDETRLAAFAAQFEESGLYESCEIVTTTPACVRLTSSAMYASMPVYTLRYATLHLGRLYMITQTIVGRMPEQADDERMSGVLAGMKLLSTTSAPTPAPTAAPTPTPQPTPERTAGVAEVIASEGPMEVSGVPAYTNEAQLTITGKTEPSVEVRASVGDQTIGKATSKKDGTFSMRVTLPGEGDMVLAVMSDTAEAMMDVCYEMPAAKLVLTAPEETTFNGDNVIVRGETEPNATVYIRGKGMDTHVKASKNGSFGIRVFIDEEETQTFTLRAKANGKRESQTQITLTRVFTEREGIGRFREKMISVDYDALLKNPQKYQEKKFMFRGRVMTFADYNGSPCALVCVNNVNTGTWKDPVWVVLSGDEGIAEGNVVTFYLIGEGMTLPAEGQYTQDGAEVEAPVARASYAVDVK